MQFVVLSVKPSSIEYFIMISNAISSIWSKFCEEMATSLVIEPPGAQKAGLVSNTTDKVFTTHLKVLIKY